MSNFAIFWDITPCSPYMNRRFGGKYCLYLQGRKSAEQETSEASQWESVRKSNPTYKYVDVHGLIRAYVHRPPLAAATGNSLLNA
jgi:hypothetical protein